MCGSLLQTTHGEHDRTQTMFMLMCAHRDSGDAAAEPRFCLGHYIKTGGSMAQACTLQHQLLLMWIDALFKSKEQRFSQLGFGVP